MSAKECSSFLFRWCVYVCFFFWRWVGGVYGEKGGWVGTRFWLYACSLRLKRNASGDCTVVSEVFMGGICRVGIGGILNGDFLKQYFWGQNISLLIVILPGFVSLLLLHVVQEGTFGRWQESCRPAEKQVDGEKGAYATIDLSFVESAK